MISVICYHLESHAWYFPTDNLYKFLALVGTVIVILSIYFTETRVAEVGDTIINVEEVQNISKARYEALKIKLGQLKEIIDNSIAEQTGKKKAVGKLEVRYSETEIKALHRQEQDLIGEQGIEMVKVNTSMKRLEKLNERSKRIFNWNILFIAVGALMAYNGFILWYRRVQRPLDELLQNELSALKGNSDGKTKTHLS